MNYQKIYDQIVNRSRSKILDGYFEKHHIVPRSMGGSNSKDNLINLSAREHLICHILLAKIYGGKLWAAVNRMTNFGEKNSRKYEIYRRSYSKSISGSGNPRYGLEVKKSTRDAIGNKNKGKTCSKETKIKLSKSGSGKIRSYESKLNYSRSKGGKPFKVFKLIGNTFRKINISKLPKEYVGTFLSQRECSKLLNIPHQGICKALRNKKSHIYGYTFEVVDGHT